MRLHALRGDEIRPPSRGPIQANNKRPCIRWHFWQMAQAKHDYITQQITAACSVAHRMDLRTDQRKPITREVFDGALAQHKPNA